MNRRVVVLAILITSGVFALVYVIQYAAMSPEEKFVRAIAKRAARDHGWESGFIRITGVTHNSNRWVVTLKGVPYQLGAHATVEIVDGKVFKYIRGK